MCSTSDVGPAMPALLISTSTPPRSSTAVWHQSSMASESDRSTTLPVICGLAAAARASAEMSQTWTRAPRVAKVLTITAPIPPPPAVTITRSASVMPSLWRPPRWRSHRRTDVPRCGSKRVLRSSGTVDVSLALAGVGVVEAELIAAVVAHRHCHVPEVDDLDLVRVTALGRVHVVSPVHGGQGGPDDRVWSVRSHNRSIGSSSAIPRGETSHDTARA